MSEPWEGLADEIKDILVEGGEEFIGEKKAEYTVFAADVGKRLAMATIAIKTAATEVLREAAKEDLGYLRDALESRVANSGLDFQAGGERVIKKILRVAARFALTLALA